VRAALEAPEGDLRAFEQLVHRHRKRILADCLYLTRDANNSEDLAQEVFVKAFFAMRRFEGRSSFRHWLQRIKARNCLNYLKKQAGKRAVDVDNTTEAVEQLSAPPVAERRLEEAEKRARIEGILDVIPETLRVPLILRDMDELPYEEIANLLGIGLSAVKMRIKRARMLFKRLYEGAETPGEGKPAT
jgi:RNA polymerase sigma-70 factor (ECF subfamily)